MPDRPSTVLSCAISVDGCLDDRHPSGSSFPVRTTWTRWTRCAPRATRSSSARARYGRRSRLLVRSPARGAARVARGLPPHPLRVTLTASGTLPPRPASSPALAAPRWSIAAPVPSAQRWPGSPAPPSSSTPASDLLRRGPSRSIRTDCLDPPPRRRNRDSSRRPCQQDSWTNCGWRCARSLVGRSPGRAPDSPCREGTRTRRARPDAPGVRPARGRRCGLALPPDRPRAPA